MDNAAVELLCRYIRIDTSNPPGNEKPAAEFFGQILRDHAIPFKIYEPKPGRTSIRAELKGTGRSKPIIMLHHMDVIAADKDEWSFDPFGGEIIDGYVCGRGTLDTKSLGIMQLLTLLDIKKKGLDPGCDLVFLAAADEEAGGDCGVEWLLREHSSDFKAGLVLNEGSNVVSGVIPGKLMAMISPAEKGPCWMRLKRRGVSGHGSTPHGQNALERLTRAVNRLLDKGQPLKVTPIVGQYFKKMADGLDLLKPYAVDGKDETLLTLIEKHGLLANPQVSAMMRNTVSLNSMHAGSKVNVIPSYAEAEIDTRLLPGEKIEDWLAHVKSVLADDEIEIEFIMKGEGNASNVDTDSYRIIERTLQEHYPGAITASYLMLGTTDSRFFRAQGILSYGFSPAVISNDQVKSIHGVDEKIAVESVIKGTEVYRDIVTRLCTGGNVP